MFPVEHTHDKDPGPVPESFNPPVPVMLTVVPSDVIPDGPSTRADDVCMGICPVDRVPVNPFVPQPGQSMLIKFVLGTVTVRFPSVFLNVITGPVEFVEPTVMPVMHDPTHPDPAVEMAAQNVGEDAGVLPVLLLTKLMYVIELDNTICPMVYVAPDEYDPW